MTWCPMWGVQMTAQFYADECKSVCCEGRRLLALLNVVTSTVQMSVRVCAVRVDGCWRC